MKKKSGPITVDIKTKRPLTRGDIWQHSLHEGDYFLVIDVISEGFDTNTLTWLKCYEFITDKIKQYSFGVPDIHQSWRNLTFISGIEQGKEI